MKNICQTYLKDDLRKYFIYRRRNTMFLPQRDHRSCKSIYFAFTPAFYILKHGRFPGRAERVDNAKKSIYI